MVVFFSLILGIVNEGIYILVLCYSPESLVFVFQNTGVGKYRIYQVFLIEHWHTMNINWLFKLFLMKLN